jgi:hypothetical protein
MLREERREREYNRLKDLHGPTLDINPHTSNLAALTKASACLLIAADASTFPFHPSFGLILQHPKVVGGTMMTKTSLLQKRSSDAIALGPSL